MLAQVLVMGVTFASVSALLLAVGLFVRDIFSRRETPKQRLEFAAEEPEGGMNQAFFRLVEEAGVNLDQNAALAIVIGGGIIGLGVPLAFFENLLGAAGGLLLGAAIPLLYLSAVRWWRVRGMRQRLPYALQAVADAVRSGQNLSEACELVSQEIKGPLGEEFRFAHQQLELGQSPISVMNRMCRRVPLSEFRIFATAVVVHRRAGGNLSLLTERMSRSARDKQEVRNHLLAVSSGSRLSAVGMVGAAIVAVCLLTWTQPEYIQAFLEHPKGPWLMALAAGLQVLGGIWVWRILKVSF
jgi:tight adherence protein B